MANSNKMTSKATESSKTQLVKNSKKQEIKPRQKEVQKISVLVKDAHSLAVHKRTQTAEGWKRSMLKSRNVKSKK